MLMIPDLVASTGEGDLNNGNFEILFNILDYIAINKKSVDLLKYNGAVFAKVTTLLTHTIVSPLSA